MRGKMGAEPRKFSVHLKRNKFFMEGLLSWLSTGQISITHKRRWAVKASGRWNHTWLYGLTMENLQIEIKLPILIWLLKVRGLWNWNDIDRDTS
jgi:hypothetical protein